MKQKLYILGLATAVISFMGVILKINHWPGASIFLTVGLVLLSWIFIPLALADNFKSEGERNNRVLYIVTGITAIVVITGMLFKIMHWPFAGLLLTVGLPLPYVLFLPVFISVTARNKNFSLNNTVAVLFLLVFQSVFSALLALNVSKERINESYNISRNYSAVSGIFSSVGEQAGSEKISRQADSLISVIDDYQGLILGFDKLSLEEWRTGKAEINSPDSRSFAGYILEQKGVPAGLKLYSGLKNLAADLGQTDGNSDQAKALLKLSGIGETPDANEWSKAYFYENNVAWSLIYLDEMRTFLEIIKVAGIN